LGARYERHHGVALGVLPAVIAHREEPHAARREEDLFEHVGVITADLGRGRTLVETLVRARLVDSISAQRSGRDAVVRRRLVQSDEWIGVQPVAARTMSPIDDDDVAV